MMLITGASSGIGLELARVAAEKGHDLVLVARREDKLHEIARELRERHGVRVEVIASDLSRPEAAAGVVERLDTLGIQIDALVNNAGFGVYGQFTETALAAELQMIHVNIVVLTELTKRLLPGMIARRAGRILNVASTAAFLPGPLMAVYYATKAYVLSFSEAIANELEGSGVTVTVLCPGPTESGFQSAANMEVSKLFAGKKLPTARQVAEEGYDAMMAGTPLVVRGWWNRFTVLGARLMPRRAMAAIARSVQERRSAV